MPIFFLVGCGSSDGDTARSVSVPPTVPEGEDVDVFCAMLGTPPDQDDIEDGDDLADLEALREVAPAELRDDLDVVIGVFEEMAELDEANVGDEEAEAEFEAALARTNEPDFVEATERLEEFAVSECGLEPFPGDGVTGADGFEASDDGDDDAAPSPDGLITEAADVPDPLFDPFFDDPLDPSVASIAGAQYHLDVNHTDAAWRIRLGEWSFYGGGEIDFVVGGLEVTAAEAEEICAAVNDYLETFGDNGTITVGTYEQEDDGSYGQSSDLLTGSIGDGC